MVDSTLQAPKRVLQHWRLWASVVAGIAIFLILPARLPFVSRLLISWNSCAVLFLLLAGTWMLRLTAGQMSERYIEEDETAPVILTSGILAALLSLVAIIQLLSTLNNFSGFERTAHIALVALTLLSSWSLVPVMFTLHYADAYYSVTPATRPLSFPETSEPVFWDFIYFSFTIAATCQTSDVAVNRSAMRKVVIAQGIISFLFNAFILGFAINVTAGLYGK